MFTTLTVEWMILVALVLGGVLVLGWTHRRADRTGWTPAGHDHDADLRRTREDVLLVAARRAGSAVAEAVRQANAATSFDRARAELLEPGARDVTPRTRRKPGRDDDAPQGRDEHDLAA